MFNLQRLKILPWLLFFINMRKVLSTLNICQDETKNSFPYVNLDSFIHIKLLFDIISSTLLAICGSVHVHLCVDTGYVWKFANLKSPYSNVSPPGGAIFAQRF